MSKKKKHSAGRAVRDAPQGSPLGAAFLTVDGWNILCGNGWQPVWNIEEAISRVVDWTRAWIDGGDIEAVMEQQVADYLAAAAEK